MSPPDKPAEGEPILPWAEKVCETLRALWPQSSGDILPRVSMHGTSYALARRREAASDAGTPFQIDNVSDEYSQIVRITRNGGLIGILGAATYGSDITVDGELIDTEAAVLTLTVTHYLYFHYDYDGETIAVESAAAVPADTWDAHHVFLEHAYFPIGRVVLAAGVITGIEQSLITSLQVAIADVVVWGS